MTVSSKLNVLNAYFFLPSTFMGKLFITTIKTYKGKKKRLLWDFKIVIKQFE